MASRSVPRERMWNESRQMPSAGWSAARDDPPRVVVLADVAAPGERLVGDPQPALGGALGERAQLLGGERVVVDRVGRDVRADQHRRRAELLHHVELRLGAAQVARETSAAPPRSRGTAGRGRSSGRARRPARAPRPGRAASRSGRSRTARRRRSRRAAAAASFSSSVPLRHTVAIERRISGPHRFVDELGEVAQHPLAVGLDAGEQRERVRGLEDRHAAAVERAAAALAGAPEQLGLERAVDDLGDPQLGPQQLLAAAAGRGARPCRSAWRGPARRRRRVRRASPTRARSRSELVGAGAARARRRRRRS